MVWKIELSKIAEKQLSKLNASSAIRILEFLRDRVAKLDNPRSIGDSLKGAKFGEFWKYRVGDYRLICEICDDRLIVFIVNVGHRKEIYR